MEDCRVVCIYSGWRQHWLNIIPLIVFYIWNNFYHRPDERRFLWALVGVGDVCVGYRRSLIHIYYTIFSRASYRFTDENAKCVLARKNLNNIFFCSLLLVVFNIYKENVVVEKLRCTKYSIFMTSMSYHCRHFRFCFNIKQKSLPCEIIKPTFVTKMRHNDII